MTEKTQAKLVCVDLVEIKGADTCDIQFSDGGYDAVKVFRKYTGGTWTTRVSYYNLEPADG